MRRTSPTPIAGGSGQATAAPPQRGQRGRHATQPAAGAPVRAPSFGVAVVRRMAAVEATAERLAAVVPPGTRRWLLRGVAATAGTMGLLGVAITAEALKVRSHPFLPETTYDRILRFPGAARAGQVQPLVVAVLGDSTTTGIGTERVEETYAALVGEALATRGPVEVHVLGRAGARLADVIDAQLPLAKSLHPDLVLLVAGTNDATHVTPLGAVRERARRVVEELHEVPLVVAGVPRLSLARVVTFPLRELGTYRAMRVTAILRRAAVRHPDARFVSLAGQPEGIEGVPWAWLSTDRFHPSAHGYAQWATLFIPALLAADPRVAPAPDPVAGPVRLPLTAALSRLPASLRAAGQRVTGRLTRRLPGEPATTEAVTGLT